MITLNFLWHQHQPDYRHPASGQLILPWVRLHAVKGYLDLLNIFRRFEHMRCAVNFSGILLEQLSLYAGDSAPDTYAQLSVKPPASLTPDERTLVVKRFFDCHLENQIKPHPRYYELWQKKEAYMRFEGQDKAAERFTNQELTDLMVWFNLTWIGFAGQKRPDVAELLSRGRDFDENCQRQIIALHLELLHEVLGGYRDLASQGVIELSFTPYHHPILPLLHDLAAEGYADPRDPLPEFRYPQDAGEQVRRGMDWYQRSFGAVPVGVWPAEGSVSDAALSTLAGAGLHWAMTDQQNLPNLANGPLSHLQPYKWSNAGQSIYVFFRDTRLSDNIGFEYDTWPAAVAGGHLVDMATEMGRQSGLSNPVITIALDGENPWQNYPDGGEAFLSSLSQRIALDTHVQCRYPREIIAADQWPEVATVHAGSWIGGNFNIWSRHPETRVAWRRLAKARGELIDVASGAVLDHLLAAEGSDWFWWFGDDFTTEVGDQFDLLFRSHLVSAYQAAQRAVPSEMYAPIYTERRPEKVAEVPGLIQPILDGRVTSFYEWQASIQVKSDPAMSTMGRTAQGGISSLWYGFSADALFIRLDLTHDWRELWRLKGGSIIIGLIQGDIECRREFSVVAGASVSADASCAIGQIAEMRLPLQCELQPNRVLERGQLAYIFVEMLINDGPQTRFPSAGTIPLKIIAEDFALKYWSV